ncbi:MAG: hypothetical protein Q7S31_01635 [bacterium]|nr:hypothetical protein [bacterium]
MMTTPLAYILAAEQTPFGELYEYSLKDLATQASKQALQASKLPSFAEIDLAVVSSMSAQSLQRQGHLSSWLTQVLNLHCPVISVDAGCAGGGSALNVALAYLQAERSLKRVLVLGLEKLTDHTREEVAEAMMQAADWEEEGMAGLTFPALNALITARYFYEHPEIAPDVLMQLAINSRANGATNKWAHLHKKLTTQEYLSADWVSEPLRLPDCAPVSDGAAALILGREKSDRVIWGCVQKQDVISLHHRPSLTTFAANQTAMQKLLQITGVSRKDISLLEIHDAFTILELIILQDLGFLGTRVKVNLSGGLKSCGHPVAATGLRQIRDLCLRLKPKQLGLAQNMGGVGGTVTLTLVGTWGGKHGS